MPNNIKKTRPHSRRLVACALSLLGTSLLSCGGDGADAGPGQAPALAVRVIEARQQDVPLYLEMVGSTRGTQDVPIRARVDGFLETMSFEEGTFVSKGDLLYTIDPQPYRARLVEAQSQLAGAQTGLAKAGSDLERIRPLAEMNAVSQQDLDAAVAQESAARAAVQAARAAVELAEIELGYTRITAPIDGLIGLSQAKPGEYVGREPNPVVLNTLSDIDPIRARFSISEREYLVLARTYLAENDRGEAVRGERAGDLELILADGSVHPYKGRTVAASQAIDPETGTFTIEASFPNPDKLLLPGQFARVRALYERRKDAVVVPRRAVSELQGLFRVFVVGDGDTIELRDVTLGPEAGTDVIVSEGLAAGETIVVEGLQKVRPGMVVNPLPLGAPPQG